MSKLKSSLFVIGNLLVFFSIYSFIPGIIDYYTGGTDWVVFFVISIICLFTGLNVSFVFKKKDHDVDILSALRPPRTICGGSAVGSSVLAARTSEKSCEAE